MGLTLCGWLYAIPPDTPTSTSFAPLAVPTSSRLSLLMNSVPVEPGDSRSRWSLADCSPNLQRSACGEEVTRAPVQQSSDGVRGESGERRGLHLWEVLWRPTHRGSHAVIGISTSRCPQQASGYSALVGRDSHSWGWELTSNQLWHQGQSLGMYPAEKQCEGPHLHKQTGLQGRGAAHSIPARVLLVLDVDAGTLGYIVDDCFLGVAFSGLPQGVELFPAVSSVRGGATIRLRYLNGATREAPELKALCGLSIRRSMGKQRDTQTDRLPLPPALQHYLLLPSL